MYLKTCDTKLARNQDFLWGYMLVVKVNGKFHDVSKDMVPKENLRMHIKLLSWIASHALIFMLAKEKKAIMVAIYKKKAVHVCFSFV